MIHFIVSGLCIFACGMLIGVKIIIHMDNQMNPIKRMVEKGGMSEERYKELMSSFDGELTDKEIDDGWHFCNDWDGLLIHTTHDEMQGCHCYRGI